MPPSLDRLPDRSALTVKYQYGDRVSPFSTASVDILIPFHGQYKRVRDCVESILLHTTSCQYLITLVDDGSPNADFLTRIMKEAPIHGVRTDRQTGFGAAVAAGLGRTVHPWVAVLHSDCVVATRTWLQAMGESLLRLKDRGVRLVHARTDTPTVDHPALRPSRVEDRADDTVVDGDDPLPLVAFMAHRELFSRIGGPPKAYPYAGYENVELYHRMRRHGYHQAVCGASWVRHAGGATIAALPRKARREMEANYDRCVADLNGGRNAS